MQIVVLGMHRSGTSAITRLVNLMGAFVGTEDELIGANEENPKGFWERADVIEANDALLEHHNCEWYDLAAWPYAGNEIVGTPSEELNKRLKAVVERLNTHPDWVMKDPRLCHTLPYWLPLLDNPVFILVHRDPMEIARSLHTRNEFTYPHALSLWEYAAAGMLNCATQCPDRTIFISYAEMLSRPVENCRKLFERLQAIGTRNMVFPTDEMILHFIEPSLNRSRQADAHGKPLSAFQQSLSAMLVEGKHAHVSISAEAQAIMAQSAHGQRMQLGKAKAEEALGRALKTVDEQELRIHEVHKANSDALHLIEILHGQIDILKAEFGAAKAELGIIKQTRWWQLRERLLGLIPLK